MTTTVIRNVCSALADAEAAAMTTRAGTLNAEAAAMTARAGTLNANADETIKAAQSATDAATIPFDEVERMLNNALYIATTMTNTARQLTVEAIRLTALATIQTTDAARITERGVVWSSTQHRRNV
jgi:hypothetical protein